MSFSRRALLRFGLATGVSLALPRAVQVWRSHHGSARAAFRAPSALHTYEEGTDGAIVPVGAGVVAEAGRPRYSSADAVHENLGWVASAADRGGRVVYDNPTPSASSGSVYLTPHEFRPGATATVVSLRSDGLVEAPLVAVRLTADLRVDIVDGSSARLAVSRRLWAPDQRLRLDWQQSYDGAAIALTVWVYLGANVEGWRPDAVLQVTVPSTSPTKVALGQSGNRKASVGFDTYREYDTAGMPAPHAPVIGAMAVRSYDAGADGTTVALGQPGAEGVVVIGGGPRFSGLAARHGELGVLAAGVPNGGTLTYDNPYPPAHTGSLYVRTLVRGKTDSRIVSFQNGRQVLGQIKVSTRGTLCITDVNGASLAETSGKARVDTWTRIDWQAIWDGVGLSIALRYFALDAESPDGYSELGATVSCEVIPDSVVVGPSSESWQMNFDTLRTYGDVTAWPEPFNPGVTHSFSLIGDPTPSGSLVGAATCDDDHLARHLVTGLNPATQYYARLTTPDGTLVGDPLAFKTLPALEDPVLSLKIALLSCQEKAAASDSQQAGWQNILTWGPDLILHGGDFGYWGGTVTATDTYQAHIAKYQYQLEHLPVMRQAFLRAPSFIQVSDHETSGNNGDNYDDPVTATALAAFQRLMPLTSYGDARDPIRGRFLARNLSGNIRLISIDFRSLDRSPATWPDDLSKSALGQEQMDWLRAELTRPEPLKVILSDPAWGPADPPPQPIPNQYLDKWWNYRTSQQLIADLVQNEATSAGTPINIDFWGNDRHLLGYLAAANNPLGDFPVLCGSGIDQHALPLMIGERYDQVFQSADKRTPVQQYMRIELVDDAAGLITRTATGVDCISGEVKISAADTWTYA